jgi:hypothetical protein
MVAAVSVYLGVDGVIKERKLDDDGKTKAEYVVQLFRSEQ